MAARRAGPLIPLLRVQDVGWRAGGTPIVERVSLDVEPGEFVALMGRNGAGKSTLLDMIAALKTPGTGTIELIGRPLQEWTAGQRARLVSHLPQTVRTELPFTVEQIVSMGCYPHADRWFESETDRYAVERTMAVSGCLPFRGRRVATLSGGERQRVLLAACLAQRPRLLLLDEPAAFLDVEQQLHCFTLLRDQAAAGTACVAVTHDVNLALAFCTRIVVLAERTVACDMPAATALDRTDWLGLFSSRLQPVTMADGQRWVCYRAPAARASSESSSAQRARAGVEPREP